MIRLSLDGSEDCENSISIPGRNLIPHGVQ